MTHELKSFEEHVVLEKERVMSLLKRSHERRAGRMISPFTLSGEAPYQVPWICDENTSLLKKGLVVFVTVEQIDHRWTNKQLRYETYVVRPQKAAELIFEDHAYMPSEGDPKIKILEVTLQGISLQTRLGKMEIRL